MYGWLWVGVHVSVKSYAGDTISHFQFELTFLVLLSRLKEDRSLLKRIIW